MSIGSATLGFFRGLGTTALGLFKAFRSVAGTGSGGLTLVTPTGSSDVHKSERAALIRSLFQAPAHSDSRVLAA